MVVDGAKLRSLRLQRGMSQEKLGALTNLNKRTIQRAERGDAVALETLAFIADALEVEPSALRARQLDLFKSDPKPVTSLKGEVVLVPASRGSRLVNMLNGAYFASFEYVAEPTEDNVDVLEEIAEVLNRSWVNPWSPPDDVSDSFDGVTADTGKIRLQARANRVLEELIEIGITVFVGTYESWQQIPGYNPFEGTMSVHRDDEKQRVTNVLVVVSDERATHLTRMPADHEVHTAPAPIAFSQEFDDIPF